MAGTARRRGIIAEINVTPLVDIMLVLLIIFMLTAHLIARQAIQVEVPHASQSTTAKPTPLQITMTSDGSIYLADKQMSATQLHDAMAAAVAKDPQAFVLISGAKQVSHGRIIWLLDLVQSVGVTQFGFQVDRSQEIAPKDPP